jgi:hypothetical protein
LHLKFAKPLSEHEIFNSRRCIPQGSKTVTAYTREFSLSVAQALQMREEEKVYYLMDGLSAQVYGLVTTHDDNLLNISKA